MPERNCNSRSLHHTISRTGILAGLSIALKHDDIGQQNVTTKPLFKHRHAKRVRVIFLVIGSRTIRRTVHSNDLVQFFGGLRCTARRKLEIYNLQIQRYMYIGNGKIAK